MSQKVWVELIWPGHDEVSHVRVYANKTDALEVEDEASLYEVEIITKLPEPVEYHHREMMWYQGRWIEHNEERSLHYYDLPKPWWYFSSDRVAYELRRARMIEQREARAAGKGIWGTDDMMDTTKGFDAFDDRLYIGYFAPVDERNDSWLDGQVSWAIENHELAVRREREKTDTPPYPTPEKACPSNET
jgi:hypothetical protein